MTGETALAPPGLGRLPSIFRNRWLLVLPLLILFIVFFVVPVALLLATSLNKPAVGVVALQPELTFDNFIRFFSRSSYYTAAIRSVVLAATVSLATLLAAYPMALVIARSRYAGTITALTILVLVAMQLDMVIRLYGMMVILGDNGLINQMLLSIGIISEPLPLMYNFLGVVLGLVQFSMPFMILSLVGVIKGIDPSLEEAARGLGATRRATFLRITLPMSMPGILAGTLLVFALSISSYIVPALMGGFKVGVIPIHIYQQVAEMARFQFGSAVSVILFLISLLTVAFYLKVSVRRSGGPGLMRGEVPLVLRIAAIVGFCYLLAPIAIVILAGLNAGDFLTFPPDGFSLRWVKKFLSSEKYMSSFLFSFKLAAMTAIVATVLGTMAAIFLSRTVFRGKAALRAFFLSPLVLPGVVIGFSLYAFYIATGVGLSRTLWGLWIGHILYSTPYVVGTVGAALAMYDISVEEAARSLGASPWTAFWKVTFPNISSGIQAGAIFAFIVSFGQFEVSLFLSAPNNEPLPIAMYNSLRYQFEPDAAAAGIFAIVLVIASVLLTNRLINLKRITGAEPR